MLLSLQAASLAESYGGIEYYLDDLLRLAGDLVGEDEVTALAPKRKPGPRTFTPQGYHLDLVPFRAKGALGKLENRYSPALFRAAVGRNPSLLWSAHVSLGPLTWAVARRLGMSYDTVVYGLECWGDLWKQDEWALRRSRRLVSISHWTKKILVDRGFPAENIHIVHPHLPREFESATPSSEKNTGPFRLLTVSRLDAGERYKGHDHVLEAIRMLPPDLDVRYRIHGEGTDLPRLRELARGLESKVEFLPAVRDRKQIEHVYRDADCFVMPSRFGRWEGRWRGEGFGIVYLEAAVFGVPSIAYDCGGVTDIVENEKTGILARPDDIRALANAIERLARDRGLARRMGLAARERTLTAFLARNSREELSLYFEQTRIRSFRRDNHRRIPPEANNRSAAALKR